MFMQSFNLFGKTGKKKTAVLSNNLTFFVKKMSFLCSTENDILSDLGSSPGFSGHFPGHFAALRAKAMTRRALIV